jgi:hypothetical protein
MAPRHLGLLGLAAAALCVSSAQADESAVDCAAAPALPAALAGWGRSAGLQAIDRGDPAALAASSSLGGNRTTVSLHLMNRVEFPVAPGKTVLSDRYGGMIRVDVAKAGRLQVVLGEGAWIDLVRAGSVVASVEHGHGPSRSGIRKIVAFDVEPGAYVLQIANAPRPAIDAMAIAPE